VTVASSSAASFLSESGDGDCWSGWCVAAVVGDDGPAGDDAADGDGDELASSEGAVEAESDDDAEADAAAD
jgi:hypothetical protein